MTPPCPCVFTNSQTKPTPLVNSAVAHVLKQSWQVPFVLHVVRLVFPPHPWWHTSLLGTERLTWTAWTPSPLTVDVCSTFWFTTGILFFRALEFCLPWKHQKEKKKKTPIRLYWLWEPAKVDVDEDLELDGEIKGQTEECVKSCSIAHTSICIPFIHSSFFIELYFVVKPGIQAIMHTEADTNSHLGKFSSYC